MTLPPDPFTVSCFYYNKIPGQYLSFYRTFCNFYYISFPYIWEYLSPFFRYKLYTDKEKAMITYEPLWETLKRKGISQYDLLTKFGMSRGMLDNLTVISQTSCATKKRKTRSYDIPFDISYPFWSFSVQNY